ncbi:MAG TPA: hypothetical protein VGF29_17585 [Hyphomicrobiaceae bacterium]|jgi:hypothetical protein
MPKPKGPSRAIASLPTPGQAQAAYEARPRTKDAPVVKATFTLPKAVHRHLLTLCLDLNVSQQQLFMQALDVWLRQRGEPSVQELVERG